MITRKLGGELNRCQSQQEGSMRQRYCCACSVSTERSNNLLCTTSIHKKNTSYEYINSLVAVNETKKKNLKTNSEHFLHLSSTNTSLKLSIAPLSPLDITDGNLEFCWKQSETRTKDVLSSTKLDPYYSEKDLISDKRLIGVCYAIVCAGTGQDKLVSFPIAAVPIKSVHENCTGRVQINLKHHCLPKNISSGPIVLCVVSQESLQKINESQEVKALPNCVDKDYFFKMLEIVAISNLLYYDLYDFDDDIQVNAEIQEDQKNKQKHLIISWDKEQLLTRLNYIKFLLKSPKMLKYSLTVRLSKEILPIQSWDITIDNEESYEKAYIKIHIDRISPSLLLWEKISITLILVHNFRVLTKNLIEIETRILKFSTAIIVNYIVSNDKTSINSRKYAIKSKFIRNDTPSTRNDETHPIIESPLPKEDCIRKESCRYYSNNATHETELESRTALAPTLSNLYDLDANIIRYHDFNKNKSTRISSYSDDQHYGMSADISPVADLKIKENDITFLIDVKCKNKHSISGSHGIELYYKVMSFHPKGLHEWIFAKSKLFFFMFRIAFFYYIARMIDVFGIMEGNTKHLLCRLYSEANQQEGRAFIILNHSYYSIDVEFNVINCQEEHVCLRTLRQNLSSIAPNRKAETVNKTEYTNTEPCDVVIQEPKYISVLESTAPATHQHFMNKKYNVTKDDTLNGLSDSSLLCKHVKSEEGAPFISQECMFSPLKRPYVDENIPTFTRKTLEQEIGGRSARQLLEEEVARIRELEKSKKGLEEVRVKNSNENDTFINSLVGSNGNSASQNKLIEKTEENNGLSSRKENAIERMSLDFGEDDNEGNLLKKHNPLFQDCVFLISDTTNKPEQLCKENNIYSSGVQISKSGATQLTAGDKVTSINNHGLYGVAAEEEGIMQPSEENKALILKDDSFFTSREELAPFIKYDRETIAQEAGCLHIDDTVDFHLQEEHPFKETQENSIKVMAYSNKEKKVNNHEIRLTSPKNTSVSKKELVTSIEYNAQEVPAILIAHDLHSENRKNYIRAQEQVKIDAKIIKPNMSYILLEEDQQLQSQFSEQLIYNKLLYNSMVSKEQELFRHEVGNNMDHKEIMHSLSELNINDHILSSGDGISPLECYIKSLTVQSGESFKFYIPPPLFTVLENNEENDLQLESADSKLKNKLQTGGPKNAGKKNAKQSIDEKPNITHKKNLGDKEVGPALHNLYGVFIDHDGEIVSYNPATVGEICTHNLPPGIYIFTLRLKARKEVYEDNLSIVTGNISTGDILDVASPGSNQDVVTNSVTIDMNKGNYALAGASIINNDKSHNVSSSFTRSGGVITEWLCPPIPVFEYSIVIQCKQRCNMKGNNEKEKTAKEKGRYLLVLDQDNSNMKASYGQLNVLWKAPSSRLPSDIIVLVDRENGNIGRIWNSVPYNKSTSGVIKLDLMQQKLNAGNYKIEYWRRSVHGDLKSYRAPPIYITLEM